MMTGPASERSPGELSNSVSELQERLAALEETERRYHTLLSTRQQMQSVIDSMLEAVIVIDPLGRVLSLNAAMMRMYAIPGKPERITNMRDVFPHFDLTYADGAPCPHEEWPLIRATSGESITGIELIAVNRSTGQYWNGLYNAAPVRDETGAITLVVNAVVDISEQRQAASQMQQTMLQLELQRLILQERERERSEIARDLHDSLLQNLLALEYDLDEALRIDNKKERLSMLEQLRHDLQEAAHVLRLFCADMRPPLLAPFGLEKAIRAHVEKLETENPGILFQTMLMSDGQAMPEERRMTVFRIYQELMNNVIRHSGASRVSISLTLDEAQTELEIQDNGRGFQPPSNWLELARAQHFGLAGVHERASAAGGRVMLRSQPGSGTLVRVVMPNSRPEKPKQTKVSSNDDLPE